MTWKSSNPDLDLQPTDITWVVDRAPATFLRALAWPTKESYALAKEAFKELVCNYIRMSQPGTSCHHRASNVSRMGATDDGAKILKVRVGSPGSGKRGGLRVIAYAHCETLTVRLIEVAPRKDL